MDGQQAQREQDQLLAITRLRVIVGYLGEKAQFDWWPSGFLTPSSAAFLNPVFARTTPLAQYQGIKEAARRVHDDHIGVGRVFHLFRLPETLEQSLFEVLQDPATATAAHQDISSQATALAALQSFCKAPAAMQQRAPSRSAPPRTLTTTPGSRAAAGCYHAAFTQGMRSYPYLVDRA